MMLDRHLNLKSTIAETSRPMIAATPLTHYATTV